MTEAHDYAGCQREPCVRCDDYNQGWALGKTKTLSELASARPHAPACGCRPCQLLTEVCAAAQRLSYACGFAYGRTQTSARYQLLIDEVGGHAVQEIGRALQRLEERESWDRRLAGIAGLE